MALTSEALAKGTQASTISCKTNARKQSWMMPLLTSFWEMRTPAVFAAETDSPIASVLVFFKVSIPKMKRYDYNPRFAVGIVAGFFVFGMIIPPRSC